jgi:diguanylate cyclase (GGDEF)-like protein
MIDFDHFKEINDSWGHPAGDDVLVALAGALREETRPADVVGRFGGEEFVVLLPSADRYEAAAVAERILKRVRQLRVTTTDKRGGPIVISGRTTSIGVASHPADAETLPTLIQASDAAVYEAKETGRDRACQADPHSGGQ